MNVVSKPAATSNYQVGRANPISRITYHHIVGDAPAAISRFQNPGEEVSATYVIGSDGTLYQCVDEKNTPWTDANADSNSRAITVEHAGGIPSVPYTEAMYRTSIELTRSLIAKYGIKDFKRHRDVSDTPTACPGELDVERIVSQAKEQDMPATKQQVIDIYNAVLGANPSDAEANAYVGKDFASVFREVYQFAISTQRDYMAYKASSVDSVSAKDLAPGVYRVK